jgi:thiol:disulfide interchange protein DsbC
MTQESSSTRRHALRRSLRWAGLSAVAAAAGPAALAATPAAPAPAAPVAPDRAALARSVEALVGARVDSIAPAPIAGLYEVFVGGRVFYIDAAGRHIVQGQIFEIATRQSLTAQRQVELERALQPAWAWSDFDLRDAVRTVYGSEVAGRELVVFEDPRCGFCRRLHQTLAGMPDITVHTLQVSFLGPESRQLNETVWCSADRSRAWAIAMAGGMPPPAAGCDLGALERNMALAERLRVRGTPTIFTRTGQRIGGAVEADVIERALRPAAGG